MATAKPAQATRRGPESDKHQAETRDKGERVK